MPSLGEVIMSYATLMVHLDLDQENDARLSVIGDLAERFMRGSLASPLRLSRSITRMT
jgi:hypothetical protein